MAAPCANRATEITDREQGRAGAPVEGINELLGSYGDDSLRSGADIAEILGASRHLDANLPLS